MSGLKKHQQYNLIKIKLEEIKFLISQANQKIGQASFGVAFQEAKEAIGKITYVPTDEIQTYEDLVKNLNKLKPRLEAIAEEIDGDSDDETPVASPNRTSETASPAPSPEADAPGAESFMAMPPISAGAASGSTAEGVPAPAPVVGGSEAAGAPTGAASGFFDEFSYISQRFDKARAEELKEKHLKLGEWLLENFKAIRKELSEANLTNEESHQDFLSKCKVYESKLSSYLASNLASPDAQIFQQNYLDLIKKPYEKFVSLGFIPKLTANNAAPAAPVAPVDRVYLILSQAREELVAPRKWYKAFNDAKTPEAKREVKLKLLMAIADGSFSIKDKTSEGNNNLHVAKEILGTHLDKGLTGAIKFNCFRDTESLSCLKAFERAARAGVRSKTRRDYRERAINCFANVAMAAGKDNETVVGFRSALTKSLF